MKHFRLYPLLALISIFNLQSSICQAQGYQARFEQALDQSNVPLQRQILSEWQSAAPRDPELYIARYNYHLHNNNNSSDSALLVIRQAVDSFPDRLDLRLGLAYHLSNNALADPLADALIATLDHSEQISHRWLYPNAPQETTPAILLEALTDFLGIFFDQAMEENNSQDRASQKNSSCLRRLAKRTAQLFPDNTTALNFLAVSYTLEGNYHKALRYLKRAEAIDPEDPVIQQNINDLQSLLRK